MKTGIIRKIDHFIRIIILLIIVFLELFGFLLQNYLPEIPYIEKTELLNNYSLFWYPVLCTLSQIFIGILLIFISFRLKFCKLTKLILIIWLSSTFLQLISIILNCFIINFSGKLSLNYSLISISSILFILIIYSFLKIWNKK